MSTNSGWGSVPPGVPDPEVLARMAAEFFGALPGADGPAATPVADSAGALATAATPAFLQEAGRFRRAGERAGSRVRRRRSSQHCGADPAAAPASARRAA